MLLSEVALFIRFVGGLREFLRHPLDEAECHRAITHNLRERTGNFIDVLARGVFARPKSPYRKLLDHAGIGLEDLRDLASRRGLEETLAVLFDAGVYLRLDEFKGRRPVRRGSLIVETVPHDFDNPLSARDVAGQSGGSRSPGTRTYVDFASYAHDAAYQYFQLVAFGLRERPLALWCPPPPYAAAINELLRAAKFNQPVARWFAQHVPRYSLREWKYALTTACLVHGGRISGASFPAPVHAPLQDAGRIAVWLAEMKRDGPPAVLKTNVSSGVRVCIAAQDAGLDVAGTAFRVDGEPLTPAKARVFHDVGCTVGSTYATTEAGFLGLPCANPAQPDEVHLAADKIALIQRELPFQDGRRASANLYTTLLACTSKLLLNVELGDHAVVEDRHCGCVFEELGLTARLHMIRSHDKLTSEGMNFLGADLNRLVEEVLPVRFGGHPTDYQLVEQEEEGLSRVNLLISPRRGEIDEEAVIATVLGFLNAVPHARGAYGERWRDAETLRVRREEPYATGASKILALHVSKPRP